VALMAAGSPAEVSGRRLPAYRAVGLELAYELARVSTCVSFRVDASHGIFLERRWRTDVSSKRGADP
jgi:hypothetical protein